jgi:hypothetical protein
MTVAVHAFRIANLRVRQARVVNVRIRRGPFVPAAAAVIAAAYRAWLREAR